MSVYLETRVESLPGPPGTSVSAQWSRTARNPVLAVARSSAEVALIDPEGEQCGDHSLISCDDADCTAMAWHPTRLFLVIGWSHGGLSATNVYSAGNEIDTSIHPDSKIVTLQWSPNGSRLISGDERGVIAVSEVTSRGIFRKLCQYTDTGAMTHCVFSNIPFTRSLKEKKQANEFFLGGTSGNLYSASDSGRFNNFASIGSAVNSIFYNTENGNLVVISKDANLFIFELSPEGTRKQRKKIKLSVKGDGADLICEWTSPGLLAAANKEIFVRVWNTKRDESYVLSLADPRHMAKTKDTVSSIAYNPRKRILVGGTMMGRIVMWRYVATGNQPSEEDWQILPPLNTAWDCPVSHLCWGPGEGLVSVSLLAGLSILGETTMQFKRRFGVTAMQVAADRLIIQLKNGKARKISASIRIKGLALGENVVAVWNGQKVEVHEICDGTTVQFLSTFNSKAVAGTLHHQTLYLAAESHIDVCNLQGTVKKVLTFSELEGSPVTLDIAGDFLAAVSDNGTLKLWDVSRREPRSIVPGRNIGEGVGVVSHAKVNRTGLQIALLYNKADTSGCQIPSKKLLAYDVETDKINDIAFEHGGMCPVDLLWDGFDSRILAVMSRPDEFGQSAGTARDASAASTAGEDGVQTAASRNSEVATFFVTSDHGILKQDSFSCKSDILIGSEVPFTFYVQRQGDGSERRGAGIPHVSKRVMRDFVGLEDVDESVKSDLISFSFHMSIGNMDEAYRSVKNIESKSVWENMAKMCVITRRLDVASICLGNMGSAMGARAFRQASKEPEKEVQLAALALHLGMTEEAEKLYRDCGRHDLLAEMYRHCGQWEKALAVCEKDDRIHMNTVTYLKAKDSEQNGDLKAAILDYEKCNTHRNEVPRMLYAAQQVEELQRYISKSGDPALLTWWGRYCEGNGKFEEALEKYKEAADHLSAVRIMCYNGDIEGARVLCEDIGDPAACYHLGTHLEEEGDIQGAIEMMSRSHRFNHALRLAKENDLIQEVMKLSLECQPALQIEAARYFEEQKQFDKAVLLYQRGGDIPQALEVCFRTKQFDSLHALTDQLGEDTDPEMLSRCASFFTENGQYDKAAMLLVVGKKYQQAFDLCLDFNVKISDKLAERLTPPKPSKDKTDMTGMSKEARIEYLKKLATLLRDQGSFHLATKKFTQAGDKISAMKSLLKSNDTSRIIYYATMTKKKEIYMLAANYLQNMDWHNDQEITKAIISFYTKAKALESLAFFYDACAQVEIDEYRDYEKAADALRESLKYMAKAYPSGDEKVGSVEKRLELVQQFVKARLLVKSNPEEMIRMCLALLDSPAVEMAIQCGDVYALLIEYHHAQGLNTEAYELVKRMQAQKIELKPYVNADILKDIFEAMGIDDGSDIEEDFDMDEEI